MGTDGRRAWIHLYLSGLCVESSAGSADTERAGYRRVAAAGPDYKVLSDHELLEVKLPTRLELRRRDSSG